MRLTMFLVLLALAGCAATGPIAVVPCDDLSIGFDGPGYDQQCKAGSLNTSGPSDASAESVHATTGDKRLVFTSVRAGTRRVFYKATPKDLATGQGMFHRTRNWQEHPPINGFDVALFEGRPLPQSDFLPCAGFVENSGKPVRSVGGVKKILFGFYCEDDGDDIAPADLQTVMDGLRF